jgi:methionine--tRNA ligase beta chain
MATINEFAQFDIRVGKIIEIGEVPGARTPLYSLKIDLGELGIKNIAAGIKEYYAPEGLMGKNVIVIVNLEPKKIANFVSEGMVLAAESNEKITLLSTDSEIAPGSRIR